MTHKPKICTSICLLCLQLNSVNMTNTHAVRTYVCMLTYSTLLVTHPSSEQRFNRDVDGDVVLLSDNCHYKYVLPQESLESSTPTRVNAEQEIKDKQH